LAEGVLLVGEVWLLGWLWVAEEVLFDAVEFVEDFGGGEDLVGGGAAGEVEFW